MNDEINQPFPPAYDHLLAATKAAGFTMASDALTCSLLRTLAASKPGSAFLELGTGTGLSTSWILDGMDQQSTLVSIDNDENFLRIAAAKLGSDSRLTLQLSDAGEWLDANHHKRFDFIFADTWHGKYLMHDEALTMLNPGGFYIIDDMLPQANWPAGHDKKADDLIAVLESRTDVLITKQTWSTGIVIAVKKSQASYKPLNLK